MTLPSPRPDELEARKALYDLIAYANIEVSVNAGVASYCIEQQIKAQLAASIEHYVAASLDKERASLRAYVAKEVRSARIDELQWVASLDPTSDWKTEIDEHLATLAADAGAEEERK